MIIAQLKRYIAIEVFFPVVLILVLTAYPCLSQADVFRDSLGRNVAIPAVPKKIVSLAPSITEIIYFLGLGERLVGVTQFSYFPEEANRKPKVGAYTDINIEKVITLNPDLILATADGNKREDVELLEEAGIPVYVVNPRTVHQILNTIERLGTICGVTDKTRHLVSGLKERVARVTQAVSDAERPLVFLVINVRPLISVNRKTIHHDIINLAGGTNMTGDQPMTYPRLSMEEIIKRGPDTIIISSMEREGEFEKAQKEWLQWPTLPAVQKGHVHLIDSDLIDRSAPRIVKGLEEMARLIHPEIDWECIRHR